MKPDEYPELDAAGNVVTDIQGNPVLDPIAYKNHVAAQFMCDYPIGQSAAGLGDSANPTTTTTTTTDPVNNSVQTVTKTGSDPKDAGSVTLIFKCRVAGGFKIRTSKVKQSDLKLPNCVICIDEDVDKIKRSVSKAAIEADAASKAEADAIATAAAAARLQAAADIAAKAADEATLKAQAGEILKADADAAAAAATLKAAAARQAKAKADEALKSEVDAEAKANADATLIADAGAFTDHNGFTWDASKQDLPYINPSLKFKLITPDKPAGCVGDTCYLGSSGFHKFYVDSKAVLDRRRDFHDFELLVSAATIVTNSSTGSSGVKGGKVVATPASRDTFLLR